MRHIFITSLLLIFAVTSQAQLKVSFKKGFNDELIYEANAYKAVLKQDIFNALIISDNKGNKVSFNEEYLKLMAASNFSIEREKPVILDYYIHIFRNRQNFTESYEVNIMEELKYSNNQGQKASLKIDIFDNLIYKDSKGNEFKLPEDMIRYTYNTNSKNKRLQYLLFTDFLSYLHSDATPVFPPHIDLNRTPDWMGNIEQPIQNEEAPLYEYRERGLWATIRINNDGEKYYEDSTGNYFIFSEAAWTKNSRKYRGEKGFFDHLMREYFIR